jgi:Ser/Thr protein kinase RdoA (MazF antagonist)
VIKLPLSSSSLGTNSNYLLKREVCPHVVLKLSSATEHLSKFNFQNKVLNHLSESFQKRVPRNELFQTILFPVSLSINGSSPEIPRFIITTGKYHVRARTFLDGIPLERFPHMGPNQLETMGALAAHCVTALKDFHHSPTIEGRGLHVRDHLQALITSGRSPEAAILARRALIALPANLLCQLRVQVILGGVDTEHVLVTRDQVSGLPDLSCPGLVGFGRVARDLVVTELVETMFSLLLRRGRPQDPLEDVTAVVRGFQRYFPLTSAELKAAWPLLLARIAIAAAEIEEQSPTLSVTTCSRGPQVRRVAAQVIATPLALAHEALRLAAGLGLSDPLLTMRAALSDPAVFPIPTHALLRTAPDNRPAHVPGHASIQNYVPAQNYTSYRPLDLSVCAPAFNGGEWLPVPEISSGFITEREDAAEAAIVRAAAASSGSSTQTPPARESNVDRESVALSLRYATPLRAVIDRAYRLADTDPAVSNESAGSCSSSHYYPPEKSTANRVLSLGLGRYGETRLLATRERSAEAPADPVHLGLDVFCAPGALVCAPFPCRVEYVHAIDGVLVLEVLGALAGSEGNEASGYQRKGRVWLRLAGFVVIIIVIIIIVIVIIQAGSGGGSRRGDEGWRLLRSRARRAPATLGSAYSIRTSVLALLACGLCLVSCFIGFEHTHERCLCVDILRFLRYGIRRPSPTDSWVAASLRRLARRRDRQARRRSNHLRAAGRNLRV